MKSLYKLICYESVLTFEFYFLFYFSVKEIDLVAFEAFLEPKKSMICLFNASRPDPGRREKIDFKDFILTLLCGASKIFMKVFIKPFEAPQRSVKTKI